MWPLGGDCLRDQPLHAQLGNHRACLCSDCKLCLLIKNIKQETKYDFGCKRCSIVFDTKGATGLKKVIFFGVVSGFRMQFSRTQALIFVYPAAISHLLREGKAIF